MTAKMMTEIAEQVGTVDDDLQRGLEKLVLATDVGDVPHIDQLSAGNHTLDLQPLGAIEVGINAPEEL
jgi:hypothetical protein